MREMIRRFSDRRRSESARPTRRFVWLLGSLALSLALLSGLSSIATADKKEPAAPKKSMGQIAITFNDLPASRIYDKEDRHLIFASILETLRQFQISSAGFVIGDNIESDWQLLATWLEEGHVLGNLTFSHSDLHTNRAGLFKTDVARGAEALESFLAGFGQKSRYFRYPFLHYGETPELRKDIAKFIKKNGSRVAHVSIDTDDYLYNLRMEGIRTSDDSTVFIDLRDEYVGHVLEGIRRAERLAQGVVKRKVKHILLLRVNRLNAMFLPDLLGAISDYGYEFIDFSAALKDKVYRRKDNYYGPKGISILERIARSQKNFTPAEF